MLTFAFMHYPYLVCILFGMPSLHLFFFFFKSCSIIIPPLVAKSNQEKGGAHNVEYGIRCVLFHYTACMFQNLTTAEKIFIICIYYLEKCLLCIKAIVMSYISLYCAAIVSYSATGMYNIILLSAWLHKQ